MPRVSVCIPSYNLAAVMAETINGVLNQTFTDFELLIEDDGSTDNSVALVKSYADPRIVLVAKEKNEGQNQTTNNLVKRAQGEYIALLPADDVWSPDKLEKQVAYLDAHPETGIVFSKAAYIDMHGGALEGDPKLFEPPNMARAFWQKRFMVGNCLFIATSLYRRALHEEIGYFDESLNLLADLEFYIRVTKAHELHIFDERFAKIRFRDGANLSAPTRANLEIHAEEMQRVRDKYLRKPAWR